jgi:Flp pilus assembly protein TadG
MALNMINQTNKSKQSGVAAVELALLLPLLILLIDFVVEVGIVLHNQSVLLTSTSLAARAGIAATDPKLSDSAISLTALNYCTEHLISIASNSQPVVVVLQSNSPYFQRPLSVSVSYQFQGLFTSGFLSIMRSDIEMQSTTVMYNE